MSANPGALPGWFNRNNQRKNQDSDQAEGTDHAAENATPASQSRTGGGKDDQTPVVVWDAANRMEAEIVAGRLHSEGIPAIIRGESLGTIYGLTTGSLAAATVLVPAPLAERALALLAHSVEWDESESAEDDLQSNPDRDEPEDHDTKGEDRA